MDFKNLDQSLDEHLCIKAMTYGLSLRFQYPQSGIVYQNMPVTIKAMKLPRETYESLIDIQPALNRILVKMSRDMNFMETILQNCDSFTKRLLDMHRTLMSELPYGIASKAELGAFRMDYIVVDDGKHPKQVEMNTIAAGLAGIMPCVMDFHRYTYEKCHEQHHSYRNYHHSKRFKPPEMDKHMPMPKALAEAHNFYGNSTVLAGIAPAPLLKTAILFVIEDFVVNIFDHKTIEMHESLKNITIYRRAFRTLDSSTLYLGPEWQLLLRVKANVEVEISVVYFRTAYDPKDYDFDGSWNIRALIEKSRAIKCPSLALQLVGSKAFQAPLTDPNILQRFLSSADRARMAQIFDTFVQFYPVNIDTLQFVHDTGPERFVLKQNREGGGYNYFGSDIIPKMNDIIINNEQKQYFLMDYIEQKPIVGYVIGQKDRPLIAQNAENGTNLLNSELGIFGSILVLPNGYEIFNSQSSYLLRVKPYGYSEMGIMSGQGAVSSLNLID